MKATVSGKDLKKALDWCGNFVSSRSSHPILKSVLLEAKDGQLSVRTCDGESFGQKRIAATVDKDGSALVMFNVLRESFPGKSSVTVELKETRCTVSEEGVKSKLHTIPSEEFPPMPEKPEGTVPMGAEFWGAVAVCDDAAGDDIARPNLWVVHIEDGKAIATNTHQMHVCGIPDSFKGDVPPKATKAVQGMGDVSGNFTQQGMWLESEDSSAFLVLPHGEFPNWEKVVPKEFTRTWTVDKAELGEALSFTARKGRANRVRMSFTDGSLKLSAMDEDTGEFEVLVPCCAKNSSDFEIAANGLYLLDALKVWPEGSAVFQMTEASRPIVLSAEPDARERFAVVMPMALGDR